MTLAPRLILILVLALGARDLRADWQESASEKDTTGGDENRSASPAVAPVAPVITLSERGVDWGGLFRASGRFLGVEQSFRLLTEPGTRAGLKGSVIRNYARAVRNLHGWSDGDEFYVNYVGHPMQGSVAGFLWVGNDRAYRSAEFGRDPFYWKSRLRAAGFAWVYSTQFEIGTVSEASIGAIQATPPQNGFVDHVITPSLGLGWMVAEDAIDKYLIKRIEAATTSRWIRLLARSGMNPARTFSNVLQGSAPWRRDSRAGIMSYRATGPPRPSRARPQPIPDRPGPAPYEFQMTFQAERLWGGGAPLVCIGGGAAAAVRIATHWQIVADVGGCKIVGLGPDLSGDSLAYMAGPRWTTAGVGPWVARWQFLIGGHKITESRVLPHVRPKKAAPVLDPATLSAETNGVALATGGGVDYRLNRALAIRVVDISYRRSWLAPVWDRGPYSDSIRFTTGLVLRMGTW